MPPLSPENFCYWLNGFAELTPDAPTPAQWQSIKEHLALVFDNVTPKAPGNDPTPPVLPAEIFKPRPPQPAGPGVAGWPDFKRELDVHWPYPSPFGPPQII